MSSLAPQSKLRPFRPVSFGRYTLLSPLAPGGMAELYLARLEGPQGFGKLCVIKKVLPEFENSREFVNRFVDEARILVKLTHGSIGQVLDVGLVEDVPYISLEFVDGKDLRRVLSRARDRKVPVPVTFSLYVFARVLDALAYAHRKRDDADRDLGLVHRDVSPQNVLVSYEGEVKVIDFGLAKSALSSSKTNPTAVVGKLQYMAPEQARNEKVDARSDLYSLGVCLWELINGQNPYNDLAPPELLPLLLNPAIPDLGEGVPVALRNLVRKAVQVDPAARFQTAEEMRSELVSCLVEVDPRAGPETVASFMRESFAREFETERKLLKSFASAEPDGSGDFLGKDVETGLFQVVPPKTAKEGGGKRSLAPMTFEADTDPGAPVVRHEGRDTLASTVSQAPVSEGTSPSFLEKLRARFGRKGDKKP